MSDLEELDDDTRFDDQGNVDPDGKWHMCGCGDLVLLDVDRCENCRFVDDLVAFTCRQRGPQYATCVLITAHPGPHFGNGYDEMRNRTVPVWWNR